MSAIEEDPVDSGRPNDNEQLQDARDRAREVRRRITQEWPGPVSDETKETAGFVALDYRDVLIDYREEVSTPPWEERELDWIVGAMRKEISVKVDAAGLGRGQTTTTKRAVTEVDAADLYNLTKRLDQIWRELGFGAETERNNPLYKIPDGSEA